MRKVCVFFNVSTTHPPPEGMEVWDLQKLPTPNLGGYEWLSLMNDRSSPPENERMTGWKSHAIEDVFPIKNGRIFLFPIEKW